MDERKKKRNSATETARNTPQNYISKFRTNLRTRNLRSFIILWMFVSAVALQVGVMITFADWMNHIPVVDDINKEKQLSKVNNSIRRSLTSLGQQNGEKPIYNTMLLSIKDGPLLTTQQEPHAGELTTMKEPMMIQKEIFMTSLASNLSLTEEGHINHRTFFNPLNFTRYICGHPIGPNQTITFLNNAEKVDYMDEDGSPINLTTASLESCQTKENLGKKHRSRIFQQTPSLSKLQQIPPVSIRFRDNTNKHKWENISTCDVPCRVWPAGSPTMRNPAMVEGTPFQFAVYCMESAETYPALKVDPIGYTQNKFYATTSFRSDIPLSYYDPKLHRLQQAPPIDYDNAIRGASFLAKNCQSSSHREAFVKELIDHSSSLQNFQIDSLSTCLKNAKPPAGTDMKNKTDIMRRYLFHLAFENQISDDYITEKLWATLASGTVPVYLGAPNLRRDHYLPSNSVVFANDFASSKDLVEYLEKMASEKDLYYKTFHQWRDQPLPELFQRKYDFTNVHSYCRMCRLIQSKLYGWGWDAVGQEVIEPEIRRQDVCTDLDGYLVQPFREVWINKHDRRKGDIIYQIDDVEGSDCTIDDIDQSIDIGNNDTHIVRNVWVHDGVIDLDISATIHINVHDENEYNDNDDDEKNEANAYIRLAMPIQSNVLLRYDEDFDVGRHRYDKNDNKTQTETNTFISYWLQDDTSRVSILLRDPVTNTPIDLKAEGGTMKDNLNGHEKEQVQEQEQEQILLNQHGVLEIPIIFDISTAADATNNNNIEFVDNKKIVETKLEIRLILEDIDNFHFDAFKYETYFGKRMKEDFFVPVKEI